MNSLPTKVHPLRLFLGLLAIIFVGELSIMFLLDRIFAGSRPQWLPAWLDATLLTAGCVPFFWRYFLKPLQSALELESVKAQVAMEMAAEGIIALDERGFIQTFNRAAEQIFGYAEDEVRGKNVLQLLSMFDAPGEQGMEREFTHHLGMSDTNVREAQGIRKDGSVFPVEIALSELKFAGNTLFTAIVRDITERQSAGAALQESEERYRALFDYSGDAIIFIRVAEDGRRIVADANEVACQRLGYQRSEMLGMEVARFNVPGYPRNMDEVEARIRQHQQVLFETLHMAKDGRHIPVEVHARAFKFRNESMILSVVRDITERKRAQSEQEALRRNQQALLNAIQESAFLMERNGRLLVINEVGAKRLKATPEELIGKNAYEILPPEVAQARRARFEQIAERGIAETFEDERAGRRLVTSVYPIRDAAGEISRFAAYSADVTQQRRLQAIEELFPAINQQVLQGSPLNEVLDFVCQKVAELFQFEVVWVGRKEPAGVISILASAGAASGYVDQLKQVGVRWDDTPQGRGPAGSAIRLGQPQLFKVGDPRMQSWTQIAQGHELQSMLGIPLVIRGEIFGAFTLYSSDPAFFDFHLTFNMLTAIATRISTALELAIDQQQVRLLSSALSAASNAVMITDRHGRIQWVNPAFSRLTGYTREEMVGQTPRLLNSGQYTQEYYKNLWETIGKGEAWSGETIERNKEGSLYTVSQTITPIIDDKGVVTHFIAIHEDITAQKLAQERIHHMANFDALTSLPNRALFYDRLRQALVMAKRNNGGMTLLFLDLDGFKKVNDIFGHHIGDLVLTGVAGRLHQCVRESDTVARLGGDEFTVILNDTHEYGNVAKVAEKIIEAIAAPFFLEGHAAHIGVSIGIARYAEDASSEDDLVNKADQAMYAAKSAGKNTYRFSSADR